MVSKIEELLKDLDKIQEEKKLVSEKLIAKIHEANHIQQYLRSIDKDMQINGDRMYNDLNKKRTDNIDLKERFSNIENEIEILQEILKVKESESSEISGQCKGLLQNKSETMECIKNINDEVEELVDKLEEASHIIQSLKIKNNNREKEINKMALQADELFKKYTTFKEKTLKEKHNMIESNKVYNSMVGSRLKWFTKMFTPSKKSSSIFFNII